MRRPPARPSRLLSYRKCRSAPGTQHPRPFGNPPLNPSPPYKQGRHDTVGACRFCCTVLRAFPEEIGYHSFTIVLPRNEGQRSALPGKAVLSRFSKQKTPKSDGFPQGGSMPILLETSV